MIHEFWLMLWWTFVGLPLILSPIAVVGIIVRRREMKNHRDLLS